MTGDNTNKHTLVVFSIHSYFMKFTLITWKAYLTPERKTFY